MLAQTVLPREPALAPLRVSSPEIGAVKALMTEDESAVSDAPLYRPEAAGLLLLLGLVLLSPKEPKEKK
ncbi:hypothetical protein [Kitasatospora cheerisanensis]|uniref:Uncharacterized protein n=1 Tax=Kitasatospora cheerisanensis KCTC 2395 TaxID=1348663 RepID=A0A066ZC16_9ACTN|nr:hypothetical protein [Kitasatospora cheerisanensis]KDN87861.1 hypothetical protein KCH_05080 [Kitasatospora cheerisanensis KCTC 2395]